MHRLLNKAASLLCGLFLCVGVSDGDTITVLNNNRTMKIRLYGIDCPEKRQEFGNRAKQFTAGKVFKKDVKVDIVDYDRYGRAVALVYYQDNLLNIDLIKSGYAWVYRKYCKKPQCSEWLVAESEARGSKRGLWNDPFPTPPWEFRRKEPAI